MLFERDISEESLPSGSCARVVAGLLKLFVEPTALRRGIGETLFAWATRAATQQGADRLVIEADPDAAAFYRQMGAKDAGLAPSGAIPGRTLPRLVKILPSPS